MLEVSKLTEISIARGATFVDDSFVDLSVVSLLCCTILALVSGRLNNMSVIVSLSESNGVSKAGVDTSVLGSGICIGINSNNVTSRITGHPA